MKLIIRFRDSVNSKEDIWMHGNVANRWFPRQNKLCSCQRPVNLAQTALVIASHHRERKVQPFDNSKDLLEVLLSTRKVSIFRYFMFANLSDASALWYSLGWLSRYRIDLKYSKNEDIARVTVFSNICNLIFAVFFWERWLFRLDLETSRTNFKALYGVTWRFTSAIRTEQQPIWSIQSRITLAMRLTVIHQFVIQFGAPMVKFRYPQQ